MRLLARLTMAGVLLVGAVAAQAGEVKVSFSNGLVTIVAANASPREILGEWARRGQVRVTNLDRLAGEPITMQLTDVPETQALETVLRGTAGYAAAPRREAVATIAVYDRILLLPGVAPALPVATATPPSSSNAGAGRGRVGPPPFGPPSDDESGFAEPTPGMTPPWTGRDAARPVPDRRAMPGQATESGTTGQPRGFYPGILGTQSPTTSQPSPALRSGFDSTSTTSRSPGSTGSVVPGVLTTSPTPEAIPASNAGSQEEPAATMTGSAARPGELTSPSPAALAKPNQLSGAAQQPSVVNPAGNPAGTAAKPGTPTPTTTPTGPIKDPE